VNKDQAKKTTGGVATFSLNLLSLSITHKTLLIII